jgi:uncharacterized protein (TIGR00725 family)
MWQPLIAIAGASKPTDYQLKAAATAGELIARRKALVVCGGLGGVMDAAARGAASVENSISVGLLPGLDLTEEVSSALTIPMTTGLGEIRNVVLARACRAMIAIGGGYGTLTEIAFALRLHKPLALIDSWEFSHPCMAADPATFFTAPRLAADSAQDAAARDAHAVASATAAVDWIFEQLSGNNAG